MTPRIIDRGRGPEIEGTRITVYTIWDYARHGDHHTYIARTLGIPSAQVLRALEYIEEHKAEVLADYQEIMDRIARGNPPEVEALRKQSHAKFLALKRQFAAKRKLRGTRTERNSSRR